jgi:hypothetical protein
MKHVTGTDHDRYFAEHWKPPVRSTLEKDEGHWMPPVVIEK